MWRNCYECEEERVSGGGSSYSKTTRTEACADTWDSQHPTNYSLMNEVYETECIVSIQS